MPDKLEQLASFLGNKIEQLKALKKQPEYTAFEEIFNDPNQDVDFEGVKQKPKTYLVHEIRYETEQELKEKLLHHRNQTLERLEELKAGKGFCGEEYNMRAQLSCLNRVLAEHDPQYTFEQMEQEADNAVAYIQNSKPNWLDFWYKNPPLKSKP